MPPKSVRNTKLRNQDINLNPDSDHVIQVDCVIQIAI